MHAGPEKCLTILWNLFDKNLWKIFVSQPIDPLRIFFYSEDVYKITKDHRGPVSIGWWIYTSEGQLLIIGLLRDWQGLKYFTPSSWDHQVVITWQDWEKDEKNLQKLVAASLSVKTWV